MTTANDLSKLELTGDPMTDSLITMIKRAAAPSRMTRMNMAHGDMKKVKAALKECAAMIKAVHAMHAKSYMAKAAAKKDKPKPDDDGDFDYQDAMEKLQKGFSAITTAKTFTKSASGQLKKAMSRSGQRGQEAGDGNEHYKVPEGVTDLDPREIDTAGGGGEPFIHGMETPFPGKSAKVTLKKGMVSAQEAELAAQLAAANAKVELLSAQPAGAVFGQKPAAFDIKKVIAGADGTVDANAEAIIMKGVDPKDLVKGPEENNRAISRMIGNMIVGGQGKSVFDANFNGTGGMN